MSSKCFSLSRYARFARRQLNNLHGRLRPNENGRLLYWPGHYYSPLLDIATISQQGAVANDGVEYWACVGLDEDLQRAFYASLVEGEAIEFTKYPQSERRYYSENGMFRFADAFTLTGMIRKLQPKRIVEVGSGYSSAVILDACQSMSHDCSLTFIEPDPVRLNRLLSREEIGRLEVIEECVQEVPVSVFERLEAGDILFVDSSHVAKIGSDVTHILLRLLPCLKPGVFVHFHDIFFPHSYPLDWIKKGRAWNESLSLRFFLACNSQFRVEAFNSYAAFQFRDMFEDLLPDFLDQDGGSSFWIQKIA